MYFCHFFYLLLSIIIVFTRGVPQFTGWGSLLNLQAFCMPVCMSVCSCLLGQSPFNALPGISFYYYCCWLCNAYSPFLVREEPGRRGTCNGACYYSTAAQQAAKNKTTHNECPFRKSGLTSSDKKWTKLLNPRSLLIVDIAIFSHFFCSR